MTASTKHVPHVGFGGGSHIFIDAPLGRIEAKQALVRLFDRFPDLRLAGDEPTWRALPFFWRMEAVIGPDAKGAAFRPALARQLSDLLVRVDVAGPFTHRRLRAGL